MLVPRSARGMLARARHDERIEPDAAAGQNQQRIDIDFADVLATGIGQHREPRGDTAERRDIDRGRAPQAIEQRTHAQPAERAQRIGLVEGRQQYRHILEEFRVYTAKAQHHQGAELRIAGDAENHFHALVLDHLYQQHARSETFADAGVGCAQRGPVADAEHHAPDIALVMDPGRSGLQYQRKIHFRGAREQARLAVHRTDLGHRDADRREQYTGLRLGDRRRIVQALTPALQACRIQRRDRAPLAFR